MFDDTEECLLLIVLTDNAKKLVKEFNIEYKLANLDNILLYKWKDKKNPDNKFIALPVNKGKQTLLLKLEDDGYFICITILNKDTHINADNKFCHELPSNNKPQLLDHSNKVCDYHHYRVNHEDIFNEVQEKEYWRPYESSNIEERKWQTYLELYEKIIDGQKVSFTIKNIKIQKDKLRANLDNIEDGQIKKVQDARGEAIDFSLIGNSKPLKLGKLTSVNGKSIIIDLDKSFSSSLKAFIDDKEFKVDGQFKQCICKTKEFENATKHIFYNDNNEPIFAADAQYATKLVEKIKDKNEKSKEVEYVKEIDEDTLEIDSSTIHPLRLHLAANFISDLYQIDVMERSLKAIEKRDIWQVLSGERVAKLPQDIDIDFNNHKLNDEQKQAIKGALGVPELFLIWGPPGTGKTEVIKEIAKHEALRANKTLICSQSNLAVDNALARLDKLPEVFPFRIAKEGYAMEGEDTEKVPFMNTSGLFFIESLQQKIKQKIKQSSKDEPILNLQKQFFRRLEKSEKIHKKKDKSVAELREFSQHAKLYKQNINVVGTTLMEAGKQENRKNKLCETTGIKEFDVVIIDEVSKATPPELFIPVSLGKRLILVGDHKQLPPMFKMLSGDDRTQEEWAKEANIDASELDIDSTIFQRLWERHINDASPVRAMLTQQYRMHPKIQSLIEPFYTDSEGTLSFGFGKDNEQAINDLTLNNIDFCKHRPIMWIGTKNKNEIKVGTSFVNNDEVEKVGKLLNILAKSGDKELSVGVITFYGAQLGKLRKNYEGEYCQKFGNGKLIFGTVDRFQGRECDVIICSLVRKNKNGFIGFASKINRINVAFSRARKSLIILGSKEQFCYEIKNKEAQKTYKYIYDECCHPKPKELEGANE